MIEMAAMFVFYFTVAVILFYTFLLIVSLIQLRRMYELDEWEPYEEMLDVSYTKPVSILVPAYNEEVGIFATVRSLLSIEYPEYEIVVINDGSTDDSPLDKVSIIISDWDCPKNWKKQLEEKNIKLLLPDKEDFENSF